MFFKRNFNMSVVLICVIALGLGFLSGYLSSFLLLHSRMAHIPQPTPVPANQAQVMVDDAAANMPTSAPIQPEQPVNADAQVTQEPEQNDNAQKAEKYTVREYMGKIAVYKTVKNGETTLASLTDVDVSSLPDSDRQKLKQGITVSSEEDMLQILEDYLS